MANILDAIIADKRNALRAAMERTPLASLQRQIATAPPTRGFAAAITAAPPAGIHLIAEMKRRSPSAGPIRPDLDPAALAQCYAAAGATAISVLTDEPYFGGRLADLARVRDATALPILRKDFIVADYQVWEARAAGADAILLIGEVLTDKEIVTFARLAGELGMSALVESHSGERLTALLIALGSPLPPSVLIGINNRDLTRQKTDLATTVQLAARLPDRTPLVAESGIHDRADVLTVQQAGAQAILVGESILAAPDPAQKIHELLGTTGTV